MLNLSQDIADLGGTYQEVNPSQFFSYFPRYEYLDKLLSLNPKKHINLFIDVKGCATSLFLEWAVRYIIDHSRNDKHIDMSLFSGIMEFIAFHILYGQKRDIDFNFYFFMEQGKSVYHKSVYKDYKANRCLSDFFGLDLADREYFYHILDMNYDLCEYVFNKIPNVCFFRLKYLEADFIPWYLMKYVMSEDDLNNSINLTYTKDKDMLQNLQFPNSYQFYKGGYHDSIKIITPKSLLKHWAKLEDNVNLDRVAEWFPLFLSILGDAADGIPGLKGIGAKTIVKNIDAIVKTYGNDPDIMFKEVLDGKDVLAESFQYVKTASSRKMFGNQDILKRNMQLISFRALSEWLNSGYSVDNVEKKKYIENTFHNTSKLKDYKVIINALNAKGLNDVLNEKTVERCFSVCQ